MSYWSKQDGNMRVLLADVPLEQIYTIQEYTDEYPYCDNCGQALDWKK